MRGKVRARKGNRYRRQQREPAAIACRFPPRAGRSVLDGGYCLLPRAWLDSPNVLDEHELDEPVGFPIVFVVMALAQLADLGELCISERASRIAEGLERVFGL